MFGFCVVCCLLVCLGIVCMQHRQRSEGDVGAHGPGVTRLSQELRVLGTTPRFSRRAVSALPAESLLQLPNAILTNLIRYS